MMKVYALLIQKYRFDLQDKAVKTGWTHLEMLDALEGEYRVKMEKLFNRLQKYHNFDMKKFYQLQDQSVTF